MPEVSHYNQRLFCERRRFFRYGLTTPLPLLVENKRLGEALGMGLVAEIGTGGLCIQRLPLPASALSGDELDILLLGDDAEMPLRGQLIRHTQDGQFGVALNLSDEEGEQLEEFLVSSLM